MKSLSNTTLTNERLHTTILSYAKRLRIECICAQVKSVWTNLSHSTQGEYRKPYSYLAWQEACYGKEHSQRDSFECAVFTRMQGVVCELHWTCGLRNVKGLINSGN